MDLGAMVCTPRDPACPACPLEIFCQSRQLGVERQLPEARVRKAVPLRRQVALLAERDGRLLVRPRPAAGFLGGLWEFPVVDRCEGEAPLAATGRLARELGLSGPRREIGRLRHAYSHFTLDLDLVRMTVLPGTRVAEGGWQWQAPAQLARTPLHGAHRKALAHFNPADVAGRDDE